MECGGSRQLGKNRRELRAKDGRLFATRSAPITSEPKWDGELPSKDESGSRQGTTVPQDRQFSLFYVNGFNIVFNKFKSKHSIVVDIINYFERNGKRSSIKSNVSFN